MEYLEGGTLKAKTGTPMPYADAAGLLLPVARALEYAHNEKIIHRDVKPANILLSRTGEPHLSDFRVAKILEVESSNILTGTGVGWVAGIHGARTVGRKGSSADRPRPWGWSFSSW